MFSYRFTILPLWLKWRKRINQMVVLAPRGMLHEGAFGFKPFKKKLFVRLLNASGIPRRLVFHATDEQEKKDVYRFFPAAGTVCCIPNFPRAGHEPLKYTEKHSGRLCCVYVSRLSPKKNILYFLQLLHKIPTAVTVSFTIRGEIEDRAYWQQCEQSITSLPGHITVKFDGPVQNDIIVPFLQEHHLFVLPTLGENFGHAVFEAFVAGRPVLISDKTPWQGLADKQAGWDVPLNSEDAFIAAVQQAATMEQEEFNTWCMGAWQLAAGFIQQSDLKRAYLKLFNEDVHFRN
jgi:hypothetical protein